VASLQNTKNCYSGQTRMWQMNVRCKAVRETFENQNKEAQERTVQYFIPY